MPRPKPQHPPVQMPIRVSHKLRMQLNDLATQDDVSLNALCVRILEEHVKILVQAGEAP